MGKGKKNKKLKKHKCTEKGCDYSNGKNCNVKEHLIRKHGIGIEDATHQCEYCPRGTYGTYKKSAYDTHLGFL